MKQYTPFFFPSLLMLAILAACSDSAEPAGETSEDLPGYVIEQVPETAYQVATKSNDGAKSAEGYLRDGKKTGMWMTFYSDGRIQTIEHYLDGKLNGVSLKFSSRGQIEEKAHYLNNMLHGSFAKYKFGRPQEVMPYNKGKLDGQVRKYYTNGKVREEIDFKNGVQHGSYKYYNEDGSLSLDYTYENGEKVSGGIVE